MRFYTGQHQFYGGIDLHARTLYLCILNQAGETLLHKNLPARPKPLLKAIADYREDIVLAVECIFTWYWIADLCAEEGIPFVLGHALYMKAIHGGKAKNDKIDSAKIAALLRGGMIPQAYVYPREMRATRDLLRRRMHLMRKRAELLAHIQNTNSQYNLPDIGKKVAYKANREGIAERFPDPDVQRSVQKLRKQDHGKTGQWVLHFLIVSLSRFLIVSFKWAFSEAAVLFLRNNEPGPKYLAQLERRHGKGKALSILAHRLARAVYTMLKREEAFDMSKFLQG